MGTDGFISYHWWLAIPAACLTDDHRDGIFKLLRSPGVDSKEPIPLAYVAWASSFKRFGAQESIPRNEFRQPIQPGGPVR